MVTALIPAFSLMLTPPLTEGEVFAKVRAAYGGVSSLKVEVKQIASDGEPATAKIQFSKPSNLRVTGTTLFGTPYDLVAKGGKCSVLNAGRWQDNQSMTIGIAMITGLSGMTGTIVPSLLTLGDQGMVTVINSSASIKPEKLNGKSVYHLHTRPVEMWVDSQSYFIVKTFSNFSKVSNVSVYSKTVVNQPIPASVFVKPKS
jgi:hypothetical protein